MEPLAKRYSPRGTPLCERLLSGVEFDPNTGCWLWSGTGYRSGYGAIQIAGRSVPAHRAAWAAFKGEDPGAKWVLHRCDTPRCCNPGHLFLGDAWANALDRKNKGRGGNLKGAANGRAILSREAVAAIRAAPTAYGYRVSLAAQYGVSVSAISRVRNGRAWGKLT